MPICVVYAFWMNQLHNYFMYSPIKTLKVYLYQIKVFAVHDTFIYDMYFFVEYDTHIVLKIF